MTPPAQPADEGKTLGQIAYEEWNAIVHPSGGIPWERVGMQVGWENIASAATASLREVIATQEKNIAEMAAALLKGDQEIERLKEAAERYRLCTLKQDAK